MHRIGNPARAWAFVLAMAGALQTARADISLRPPAGLGGKTAAAIAAAPFALQDVRLLDGPFARAMERERRYLLSFDPDRLLHTFRVNAGLSSMARPLGGWERPDCEVRGHFLGHYLSACALMHASTGDAKLKERAERIVAELAKCQEALGTSGYLSAFPESFIDRVETTGQVWAPYYTLHKILAGLLDAHAFCGSAQALAVARKFGDWVAARNARLDDARLERMLGVEHGGINEGMANLYAATGDARYLEAARRLCHKAVLDPLAARRDALAGLHANTQFPKVIGAARLYELTGEERCRTIAEFFWDRVVRHHSYANGGNSDREHFGPPGKLAGRLSPWTAESCNTYNMLKLTRHVFAWSRSAAYADYYERALYNHILASQDPRTGMMAYHVPLHGGWFMPYNTPEDSFWCCTGTGVENHAKYGDSIYWRDAEGLLVNLFIPSELSWREKGLVLRQRTRYPEEDTTRLDLECAEPVAMALRIRYPGWARDGMAVSLNGEPVALQAEPGGYASIARTWTSGDRVEVRVPMRLRLEPLPDDASRVAIFYGPVLLAGALGTDGIAPPAPYARNQTEFFTSMRMPEPPVLVAAGRPVDAWVEPVAGAPLTFRTKGVGRPADVTLVAFHAMPPQRYTIYWDLLTEEALRERAAAEEARTRRERELAARSVDSVAIGDAESERAHGLRGEKTRSGPFADRFWRDAENGGWFSYDLAVPGTGALELFVVYWGSDSGAREFDILVGGEKIATQKLAAEKPDRFFDAAYPIPRALTDGKTKVTVKFLARPGNLAGGIFDCRLLRGQ